VVFQSRATIALKCRCGVRIPSHRAVYGIAPVPASAQSLFRDERFCSSKCIRAFLLESLETVAGLDTPESKRMVSDLHDLYRGLAEILASVPD